MKCRNPEIKNMKCRGPENKKTEFPESDRVNSEIQSLKTTDPGVPIKFLYPSFNINKKRSRDNKVHQSHNDFYNSQLLCLSTEFWYFQGYPFMLQLQSNFNTQLTQVVNHKQFYTIRTLNLIRCTGICRVDAPFLFLFIFYMKIYHFSYFNLD